MPLSRLQQIEAARYVVLQRLAPAIRHGIVGKLHPVGLVAEALARRMQGQPDPVQMGEGVAKVHELARTALAGCTDLLSWLGNDAAGPVPLGAGIRECLALLETDFGLQGHAFSVQVDPDAQVDRLALRQVLPAALMAWPALLPGPSDLQIHALGDAEGMVRFNLSAAPATRQAMEGAEPAGRVLRLEEAVLLAEDAGAVLERAPGGFVIRMPVDDRQTG